MKPGAVPYWHCGGDVLTRMLSPDGRLAVRALSEEEANRLARFYGDADEARALTTALGLRRIWRQASQIA